MERKKHTHPENREYTLFSNAQEALKSDQIDHKANLTTLKKSCFIMAEFLDHTIQSEVKKQNKSGFGLLWRWPTWTSYFQTTDGKSRPH